MDKETLVANFNKIKSVAGDVEIVPASKTRDIETIEFVSSLGVSTFGENRVQEWLSKKSADVEFDFIGRLQTNKVKYLVGEVRYISSVDRIELAEEISKYASRKGIVQDVLIELNMGREEAKGGIFPENLSEFAELLRGLMGVSLKGIMTVMPITDDRRYLEKLYKEARSALDELQSSYPRATVYSGGMSSDYDIAVACGATSIRPGRALFGDRVYK